jgi:hypothetical protein
MVARFAKSARKNSPSGPALLRSFTEGLAPQQTLSLHEAQPTFRVIEPLEQLEVH